MISSRRATPIALLTYAAIVIVGLTTIALSASRWLDEFWSVWLTDPAQPFGLLLHGRWMPDPHPILFSALLHIERLVVPGPIELNRLLTNGTAFSLAALASWGIWRASPSRSPFYILLPIIVFGTPYAYREFGDLRSYAMVLAATTVYIQFAHYAFELPRDVRPSPTVVSIGAISAFLAIALHFVGGLQSSVIVVVTLAVPLARRRRFAWWIAGASIVAWTAMLVSGAIQSRLWVNSIDVRWQNTSLLGTLKLVNFAGVAVLIANLPTTVASLATLRRRASSSTRLFQLVLVIAVLFAVVLIVTVNAIRPVVIDRYLAPLYPAMAGIIAAGATEWWRDRPIFRLVTIVVGTIMVLAIVAQQSRAVGWGWSQGTGTIARLVRDCPQSRVYAISPWAFSPAVRSTTAQREDQIFTMGYKMEAGRASFAVTVLPPVPVPSSIPAQIGPCPAILWVEHIWPAPPAAEAFARSGLALPPNTVIAAVPGGKLIATARR